MPITGSQPVPDTNGLWHTSHLCAKTVCGAERGPAENALELRDVETAIHTTAATSAINASFHCHRRIGEPFLK
jgi:hypothetical protein